MGARESACQAHGNWNCKLREQRARVRVCVCVRERDAIGICVLKMKCQIAELNRGSWRRGRQAGRVCVCVCASISEFPVLSWLLIMRVELPECSLNARICMSIVRFPVRLCLPPLALLGFLFYMFALLLFFFFAFAFFPSCLCHLTELPLRGRPAFKQLMPTRRANSSSNCRQLEWPKYISKYRLNINLIKYIYIYLYTPYIPRIPSKIATINQCK